MPEYSHDEINAIREDIRDMRNEISKLVGSVSGVNARCNYCSDNVLPELIADVKILKTGYNTIEGIQKTINTVNNLYIAIVTALFVTGAIGAFKLVYEVYHHISAIKVP